MQKQQIFNLVDFFFRYQIRKDINTHTLGFKEAWHSKEACKSSFAPSITWKYNKKSISWKKALTWPCWNPNFELSVTRTLRKKFLWFINHSDQDKVQINSYEYSYPVVQHCLLERLFFHHWLFLALLSKINWPKVYGFISGHCILFHWCICLSLCQQHNVLVTVAM